MAKQTKKEVFLCKEDAENALETLKKQAIKGEILHELECQVIEAGGGRETRKEEAEKGPRAPDGKTALHKDVS